MARAAGAPERVRRRAESDKAKGTEPDREEPDPPARPAFGVLHVPLEQRLAQGVAPAIAPPTSTSTAKREQRTTSSGERREAQPNVSRASARSCDRRGTLPRPSRARRSRTAIAPICLAVPRAPSPAASESRTSRVNVGKTVMLEKPKTSAMTTTSAIKATRRFRVISVIDREKLGTKMRRRSFASRASATEHEPDRGDGRRGGGQDERGADAEPVDGDTARDRPDGSGQEHAEVDEGEGIRRPSAPTRSNE